MKKFLFCLLITLFTVVTITAAAYAADSSSTASIVNDYLTWEFLGTMAGAVAATTLITQFLKLPVDRLWKIPTRFVVYVIALSLLFAVEFFTGGVSAERVILIILNAVVVASASMGAYEITFKKLESRASV